MAVMSHTETNGGQPEESWLVPTTAGSVTLVVGSVSVAALLLQATIGSHTLNIPQLAFVVTAILVLIGLDRLVQRRFGEAPPRSIALTSLIFHFS